MKRSKLAVCVSVLMFVQGIVSADILNVPSRTYPTIREAVSKAKDGDVVVLAPNPNPYYPVSYSGPDNTNIDLGTKNITIRSQTDPCNPNWDVINSTIIDCGGAPLHTFDADGGMANRAFYISQGQTSATKIIGLTIMNGYARGPKGADGAPGFFGETWLDDSVPFPWEPIPGEDPCTLPPWALNGDDAVGPAYGGAIYCHGSSPSIEYCVFKNCTVTGAEGGRGADGLGGGWEHYTLEDFNWAPGPGQYQLGEDADLEESDNGQWGGFGGDGIGNGYGGAIACLELSNPFINGCIFKNNYAQGGRGGDGGRGGNGTQEPGSDPPTYTGERGVGGNGGLSIGDGIGGAIYAEGNCNPFIVSCNFQRNLAKTGPRAARGEPGFGNGGESEGAWISSPGFVIPGLPPDYHSIIAGGAVYLDNNADATFVNCSFVGNKAYHAFIYDPNFFDEQMVGYPLYLSGFADDIAGYTSGGAVFCVGDSDVIINTCDFISNFGGAVYFNSGCNININNDYAVSQGHPGRKNRFVGNTDPHQQQEMYYYGPTFDRGMGGAIFISSSCPNVNIANANFGGNRAKLDGGAVKSLSNINLTNCAFSGNIAEGSDAIATGYGGAIDVYNQGATLQINMTNCSFLGNESVWGGAFSSEKFTANLNHCFFYDNKAEIGGALDLGFGIANIAENVFSENRAIQGDGGGISLRNCRATIEHSEFLNNSAGGSFGSGGAIDIDGYNYSQGNFHSITNCLFAGNRATSDGGAITCDLEVEPEIQNCTFSNNKASVFGGAIFADLDCTPSINDCIFEKSNNYAIYEVGDATTRYCLFYDNPDGHYFDSDIGPVGVGSIPGGSNNLEGDPLFVTGAFGDFYLSQIAAGQGSDSPAFNNGSVNASVLGLNTRTTRTDDVGDAGLVDRGYHFARQVDVPQYQLATSVVDGQGTISPGGTYFQGTVVDVNAIPQSGWTIIQWVGTEDDTERASTSKVVINTIREVTVEFKQPNTLLVAVGGGQDFSSINDAMAEAQDGDIIVVYPGLYNGPQIQFTKSVEVRSLHPDDPNCIDQTIIESAGHAGPAIWFPIGTNSGSILNGFIIRNSRWYTDVPLPVRNPGENGRDGVGTLGGAIWIGPEAGPVIKNCIVRDNQILGGYGGNGADADETHNAGRGGWGAWARGGAIYCSQRSYPKFINCQILNNQAIGGFGGNGGNEALPGGFANYGGNWSRKDWFNYDPRDRSVEWVEGDLWARWSEMDTQQPSFWRDDYLLDQPGYFGDYRWYSGYGGGVFVNEGSKVTFENCVISGNLAQGGLSGLGGELVGGGTGPVRPQPFPLQYEIPAYGGGVYIATDSKVTFKECTISDNTASNPLFDHRAAAEGFGGQGGYVQDGYDPCDTYSLDPYLGHGGGVCAENTADVTFIDCDFSGNRASVGGGLFGAEVTLKVSNCEFLANRALQGGGLFGQDGSISIAGSNFAENLATDDPNDPEVLGNGAGLHFWSAKADIADTYIIFNEAETMAGGLYCAGSKTDALLKNCLLVANTAGQAGAAAAATTFANLTIANCTITENEATGIGFGDGLGGGLYAAYESYIGVINSILWDNTAFSAGDQIAIGTQDYPSTVKVTYSNVQGGSASVFAAPATTLLWDIDLGEPNYPSNINANPYFVGEYYLSQIDAGQLVQSPCVDAGSGSVASPDVNLVGYTTMTTGVDDVNIVDMGFHHSKQAAPDSNERYTLTVEVIGPGTYALMPPNTGFYSGGQVVTITAYPDSGYRVSQWTGTDDDSSAARVNTVTMDRDRIVIIEFGPPDTLLVPGDYTTIQAAIEAAREGDVISVASGVYNTPNITINKEITVTSTNPDDPCVVAITVVDGTGIASRGFIFGPGATERTVLDGITIANTGYGYIPAEDGENPGDPGGDGGSASGSGVYVASGASPTIRNCIIRDCYVNGGNAGSGAEADATTDAGHGGWGGWARGAGIYVEPFASPTFENCTVTNCTVTGGDGGNGGDFAEDGGDAGYGGNWSNGVLWQEWGYIGDYRFYSGYGGGVYCDSFSSPTFIDCTITNNTAQGGMSGIGGSRQEGVQIPMPDTSYRIPSYGGGVYCAENSDVVFIGCNISGNAAPRPDDTFHLDPYLGHGGGIAFERTASIEFINCVITDNDASVGGGMFWSGGAPEIIDSEISTNVAYVGGGIYGTKSQGLIRDCNFYNNFAGVSPDDVDQVVGRGSGVFISAASMTIEDCFLSENVAGSSGGAICVFGATTGGTTINNCLMTGNEAGRDGGAVSVNWGATTTISSCTLYNNRATGTFGQPDNTGFGGGLYCSYEARTDVIDSIFWRNNALFGPELALESGFEFIPRCGTISVSYSDIRTGQAGVHIGSTCDPYFLWDPAGTNLNRDPLFVNEVTSDFHLQHIGAGQPGTSPCIDAGSDLASILGLAPLYSTRTDGVPDWATVDMGYHYPTVEPCRFADLRNDGIINLSDFAIVAAAWLDEDCGIANDWCGGADLTFNSYVAIDDLVIVTDCWLEQDRNAPTPNPSRWAIPPQGVWPSSVTMTAGVAVDGLWGLDVQYYFECVSGDCHSSDWQDSRTYTDTGLTPDVEYAYRVRARDIAGNVTAPSVIRYAIIGGDAQPPTPNPMTWAVPPEPESATSIVMVATTASDPSGDIEYDFNETTGTGHDSGWRIDPCYVDAGLEPTGLYCYEVRARDKFGNTTGWSNEVCVTNLGDPNPPAPPPVMIIFPDVNNGTADVNTSSVQFLGPDGYWWHKVIVDVGGITDESGGPIEVRFICLSDNSLSSNNKIPAVDRPIYIGQPVTLGFVAAKGVGPGYRLTYDGDNIVYDVFVNKFGGTGKALNWRGCVYDESLNDACTLVHRIGPPAP